MRPTLSTSWTLLLLLGAGCASNHFEAKSARKVAGATLASFGELSGARSLSAAFQRTSEFVAPSVVRIESFRLLPGERMQPLGEGSGVVVREDGIILTNNHVVRDADGVLVTLSDGRHLIGEIIGTDKESDLAVLRLDAHDLLAAELRVETPRVGEWVLAIGNPLGLGHTVTAGIVSGLGRSELNIATYEDFIQTDAAINPGNSGGPLIDLDGRVLGINTAMASPASGGQGIGFAIPASMAEKVLDAILLDGKVHRGWLGVQMDTRAGERDMRRLGYEGRSRVLVDTPISGGPAQRAGIRRGDVIESIAGQSVESTRDLLNTIADIRPGREVAVRVWRDGSYQSLPVTLSERPDSQ